MVRTYAWNPSAQSNINFNDAKTCCNSESVSESTVDSGIDCSLNYGRSDHDIHDILSSAAPAEQTSLQKSATLFGVHTVSIGGQTYFQPFDCAMHQFINSQYSAAHGNRHYLPNYLPLANDDRTHDCQRNVEAEHLAMLTAIQSAARSQSHSTERGNQPPNPLGHANSCFSSAREETFSESWQKVEQSSIATDPLAESFKSGHNSLPDFSTKTKMSLPTTENLRRVSQPEVVAGREKKDGRMIDELPWARGNPQPKTGVRGRADWYVNDGYLNTSFAKERLAQSQTNFDNSLPPLSRISRAADRSWPNVFGSQISQGIARVLPRNLYDDSLPKNLYNFNPKELRASAPMEIPKPAYYNHPSQQSYDSFAQSMGHPDSLGGSTFGDRLPNISGNVSLSQSLSSNPAKMEKERHKQELLQQIEDNRRRKEMERIKEWEDDERRRIQDEMYMERQRQAMEEEQRKEKEKAAAQERKAEQMAFEAAAAARAARPRRRTPVPSASPPRNRKSGTPTRESRMDFQPVSREVFRSDSPPIPTLRNKMAEMSTNDQEYLPQLNSRNAHRSISTTSMVRK